MYKYMKTVYNPWMAEKYNGISATAAGEYLRERRKALGMRQSDIAEGANIPHANQVLYYEKGKSDVRKSDYLPELLRVLGITVEEARDHLGLEAVFTSQSDALERIGAAPPPSYVQVQHLGTVAAMRKDRDTRGRNGQLTKPTLLDCPLPVAHKYKSEEMFTLTVSGDSMACEDVQRTIPSGAKVLFLGVPGRKEPRNGQIVVAWLPEIEIGVLKMFSKKQDAVVLESYNEKGARFPAKTYPSMIVQGICLGYWFEFDH